MQGRALCPLPSPPQGLRGELRRSGRQLDWGGGEPLAGGPADFLLISSRKPAPCASLRMALGRGESGALRLLPPGPCPPRTGEGHLAVLAGGDAWLPGLVPALRGALGLGAEKVWRSAAFFCGKRRDLWAGASWEDGEQGGARPWQCFPQRSSVQT